MTDGVQNARRQKQAAERLERILEASARLFAEKGFHRTTTKEIAEAADIAEGTLYNYFENKNDLLLQILSRLSQNRGSSQPPEPVLQDPRQFFTAMLNSRKLGSQGNAAMQQAVLSEILVDAGLRQRYQEQIIEPTLVLLEKQLQMRIMLGQIKPLDIHLAARFIAGLWIGLFILQILDDPLLVSSWDAFAHQSTQIIFDGINLDDDRSLS